MRDDSAVDTKERLIRDFYAARGRHDWAAVSELLTEDVVWRENDGSEDYVGDHHGRERVIALLAKFIEITGGTFTLEPQHVISTDEHVAATVRWSAERGGKRVDGNDLAVFRIADGKIAEAWFRQDGYDPDALAEIFSFDACD
jgi:uncharacterized protein